MKVRFAGCTLDTDARRLWRGTEEIHLAPKAFELLRVLVDNRERAVSKAELLERVWPGVFVSDASLARVVSDIREGIGDRGRNGRIVRTVHAFGYALGAEVEVEAPRSTPGAAGWPAVFLIRGARTIPLAEGEHVAGREPDASILLDSTKVSRHHARLVVRGGTATIEDLGSKNGTFVRNVRIQAPTVLEPGDEIRIGPFVLVFRVAPGAPTTETQTVSV